MASILSLDDFLSDLGFEFFLGVHLLQVPVLFLGLLHPLCVAGTANAALIKANVFATHF